MLYKSLLQYTLFSMLVLLASCKGDDNVEVQTGSLQLSLNTISTGDGDGRLENEAPSKVAISINDATGNEVFIEEVFDVDEISGNFLIEPIVLQVGTYTIEEFLVLNNEDQVIYATPLEGSTLASLVSTPLPVNTTITADGVSDLALEVINTGTVDPEDLGYSSLSFDVIPTENILVSV